MRLERCGFRSRRFRFILSWPEVNQTSRTSSASLRENSAFSRRASCRGARSAVPCMALRVAPQARTILSSTASLRCAYERCAIVARRLADDFLEPAIELRQ